MKDNNKPTVAKTFKTKIVGAERNRAMHRGRNAARNGWERRNPAPNTRWGEAWLEGYDAEIQNPSTLSHCTSCGHMFSKPADECSECGSTNIRPHMVVGDSIVMTVDK